MSVHDGPEYAEHIASLGLSEAFPLANAILLVEEPSSPRFGRHWLRNIDEFHLDQLLAGVIPALKKIDTWQVIELLSKKLARLAKMADVKYSNSPGASRAWCRRLQRSDVHDEAPMKFAKACLDSAVEFAVDAPAADRVLRMFRSHNHEIFHRLHIHALARIGRLAQDHLDRFIVSDAAISPPFGIAEVALALRESFQHGSEAARKLFAYEIERGPGLDLIAWRCRSEDSSAEDFSTVDLASLVRDWQVDRLLWFQDRLPDELKSLAARIGHEPRKLSAREEAMAYDGFYVSSGPSVWETDTSPSTVDELRAMSDAQLIEHLKTWAPNAGPVLTGYASIRELSNTFRDLVVDSPSRIAGLISAARAAELSPPYLAALEKAIARLVPTAGSALPWESIISLLTEVLDRALTSLEPIRDEWSWTAIEGLSCLRDAARANCLPVETTPTVWNLLRRAIWAGSALDREESVTSNDALVSAAGSGFSGKTVDALVEFVLMLSRRDEADSRAANAAIFDLFLDQIEVAGTVNARASLGHLLPWVLTHSQGWTAEFVARLAMQRGLGEPVKWPIWGVYILRSQFYVSVFEQLRPAYASAANQLVEATGDSAGRSWSFNEHFAQHVMSALLYGLIAPRDVDALLHTTLSRVSVAERSQAYWLIYRSLEEWPDEKLTELIARVEEFWEWRLGQLEAMADDPERADEAKGLSWILFSPRLEPSLALPLTKRTLQLSKGELAIDMNFWDRASAFAAVNPGLAIEVVELAMGAVLRNPLADLMASEARSALQTILKSNDPQAVARAVALVHLLGERGFDDFEDLLGKGGN